MQVLKDIAAIAKGMSVTFREMFQPTVVENYPDGRAAEGRQVRGALPRRARAAARRERAGKVRGLFPVRGRVSLRIAFTSRPRRTRLRTASPARERYAKVYNIDYNRCIFCGYCVEACPTDAITHGHGFEIASYNATNLIYRKEQMLGAYARPPGCRMRHSARRIWRR